MATAPSKTAAKTPADPKNPLADKKVDAKADSKPEIKIDPKTGKPVKPPKPVKPKKPRKPGFFSLDSATEDELDETVEKGKLKRAYRIIHLQLALIVFLAVLLVGAMPFCKTIYQYYAIDANRNVIRLVALPKPNMTNRAVLSWATNSITEILTFGFGDYVPHLRDQQQRFTPDGWKSFVAAFDRSKLGQTFKERQLVLTTVPSDTAIITSQGEDEDTHVYQWKVQMPIVMTYATNDNVTRREKAVVSLTISRVPTNVTPIGVAIKSWTQ